MGWDCHPVRARQLQMKHRPGRLRQALHLFQSQEILAQTRLRSRERHREILETRRAPWKCWNPDRQGAKPKDFFPPGPNTKSETGQRGPRGAGVGAQVGAGRKRKASGGGIFTQLNPLRGLRTNRGEFAAPPPPRTLPCHMLGHSLGTMEAAMWSAGDPPQLPFAEGEFEVI